MLPRLAPRRPALAAAIAGSLLAVAPVGPAGSLVAGAGAASIYDNCTSFQVKYPHGVGKRNAVDKTSGTPVTTFKRSNKLYKKAMDKNSRLDGDKDFIACEKA